jgi:hypothetical protein
VIKKKNLNSDIDDKELSKVVKKVNDNTRQNTIDDPISTEKLKKKES